MPQRQFKLEESFGYILGRAARSLGAHINRHFDAVGIELTCEQWSILVSLWQRDGQTQQELASQTCKDKTSMTRLIDTMEKHGLVARTANAQDRRQKCIVLSAKGRRVYEKGVEQMRLVLNGLEKRLSPKDMAVCKRVLCEVYSFLLDNPGK